MSRNTIDWIGLREFISRAEQVPGEIVHIDNAHWDREMSTISHELCRHHPRPVPAPRASSARTARSTARR